MLSILGLFCVAHRTICSVISAVQLFTMQNLFSLRKSSSRQSLDFSLSPSDSHGIAECQCLCQRSKQAFTCVAHVGFSVSLLGGSKVGFLVVLHHIVHVRHMLLIE